MVQANSIERALVMLLLDIGVRSFLAATAPDMVKQALDALEAQGTVERARIAQLAERFARLRNSSRPLFAGNSKGE